MLIAYVPLLAALIGLLMYALSTNAKVVHIGDVFMWTGVLVTLMSVMSKTVHLF